MALGVALQQAPRCGKARLVFHAGEHVEQLAALGRGVGHAVSRYERYPQTPRARDEALVARFLLAVVVALQFCVHVVTSETFDQPLIGLRGETNETLGELGQLIERRRAFALFGAQFHAGNHAAQVAISLARFRQQRIRNAVVTSNLRTDVRAHARLFRRHVKARRAVDAVAVHDGHGRHAEVGAGPC